MDKGYFKSFQDIITAGDNVIKIHQNSNGSSNKFIKVYNN